MSTSSPRALRKTGALVHPINTKPHPSLVFKFTLSSQINTNPHSSLIYPFSSIQINKSSPNLPFVYPLGHGYGGSRRELCMEEAAQSHVYRGPEVEPCASHRPSASYVVWFTCHAWCLGAAGCAHLGYWWLGLVFWDWEPEWGFNSGEWGLGYSAGVGWVKWPFR